MLSVREDEPGGQHILDVAQLLIDGGVLAKVLVASSCPTKQDNNCIHILTRPGKNKKLKDYIYKSIYLIREKLTII